MFAGRHQPPSPSVSLEKGVSRLRVSRTGVVTTSLVRKRQATPRATHPGAIMLGVMLLLAFSMLGSFGIAWWLLRERWGSGVVIKKQADPSQVIHFRHRADELRARFGERYLAYLPHSGFHNQRIALENALVIAHALNRTLLVPPARLGAPLTYWRYDKLKQRHGTNNCTNIECTHVSWEWLVNLRSIGKTRPRWDMTDRWRRTQFRIPDKDTFQIKDGSRYQFQIVESPLSSVHRKFSERILIDDLRRVPHRLLEFGSLFGTARLNLTSPRLRAYRSRVRSAMALSNPLVLRVAETIRLEMGGQDAYVGAHVRIGDGQFDKMGNQVAKDVWWDVVHGALGLSIIDAARLENSKINTTAEKFPQIATPIFISTDDPRNPALQLFSRTLPSVFFLSNFTHHLSPLHRLVNGDDDARLGPFLLPFIDALIAAGGTKVVGTRGSTFSRYVADVLWRVGRGESIVERG